MNDEEALIEAIAVHPAEDTPRLIYADYMDETASLREEPEMSRIRAEFIRLQCEIARIEHFSSSQKKAYSHLYRRQNEILENHLDLLLGRLGQHLTYFDAIFERGFASELHLDAELFLEFAAVIARIKPLPRLNVYGAGYWFADFRGRDDAWMVTSLHVEHRIPRAEEIGITMLGSELFDLFGPWSRLKEFNLYRARILDEGIGWIGNSPSVPEVENLDLSLNGITDEGIRDFVASSLWRRLKRFVLLGNPIGDEGASILADAAVTSQLEHLDLRSTNIGSEGHRLLMNQFPQRCKLDLF